MTVGSFSAYRRGKRCHNETSDSGDTPATKSPVSRAHSPHSSIQGLGLCLQERRKFVDALDDHDEQRARRRLLRGYLPALREMAAGIDPERITAEIVALEERMDRGLAYQGDQQERADALFVELLSEYEVLFDAASLQHEGTLAHPTSYLLDRVLACRK